eukprot:1016252-Rhodomonas_salina.1
MRGGYASDLAYLRSHSSSSSSSTISPKRRTSASSHRSASTCLGAQGLASGVDGPGSTGGGLGSRG